MENNSVWQNTVMPEFPAAMGHIKTDVLIIGGGIAGLLTAYELKRRGVSCVIAERGTVCRGVTSGTTAKLTIQHGLIYHKIIGEYGKEKAKMYLEANSRAIKRFKKLAEGIDCDYEISDGVIYSRTDFHALEAEIHALAQLGVSAELCETSDLPFPTVGGVRIKNQAVFNPLKFLSAIAKELTIYEHTHILGIEGGYAVSNRAEISAKKIVVCTHFPFINRHGSYFLKMYQSRSSVIALKDAPRINGFYMDENSLGFSFRNCGNYLLIGLGGGRTGEQCRFGELVKFTRTNFPNAKAKYLWSAQDCMTLDGIPYIGNYSALTPDMYVATGFNKWGMTNSMAAAMILADKITGKENNTAAVFSPSRSILKKQLLVNVGNAVKDICTFTTPRCPHMGCALKWNKTEKIWECPCHGSVFAEDGELIENPSNRDLDV